MPTMRLVCMLLVVWASGCSYGQRIVHGPENVTSLFMQSAVFSCVFDSYMGSSHHVWVTPLYDVVDANSIGQQTKNYILNYDRVTNNFTLTILNVTLQDQGVYECQLASIGASSATLKIIAFPRVMISTVPRDAEVVEGAELNVTCTTRGAYPPATIAWLMNIDRTPNVTVVSVASRPSPHFSGVSDTASGLILVPTRGDSGQVLLCQACIDEAYCVNQSVMLHVRYAPNVTAVILPNLGSVTEGSTLTVSCRADSSPSVSSWRWYVNKVELSVAQNQTSITVPHISQAYDKQEITCMATNEVGSGKWSIRISIAAAQVPVAIVANVELDIGQTASFSCGLVEASPLLVVRWLKSGSGSGALVVSTSSNLTLPAVTDADAGSYTCMVSAPGGNLTAVRSLNVQLRQRDVPWLYPVIGVGSGLAVVIVVIVVVVCCVKRHSERKKSEGTSSIMSCTTENSIQKQITGTYPDNGSPPLDDGSSAGTPWQQMSDCNGDTFSRLDYLPSQLKSAANAGCSSSTAGTELCFQDALIYPTFTNNYLQFPECYKATVHTRAIPPPPPFNFYCTSDTQATAAVGPVAGSSRCFECDSPASAASSIETGLPITAGLRGSLRVSSIGFAETTGTMHSVRQYAVSAITECQLATNV